MHDNYLNIVIYTQRADADHHTVWVCIVIDNASPLFKHLMKKQNFEYDYKFDWILRKARVKEIAPEPEDYKKKLLEKLEGKDKPKKPNNRKSDDDEEMNLGEN